MTAVGGLVAHGRSADVHSLTTSTVAKVFHDDWPNEAIDREVEDATAAFDLGLTPIRCHGRTDADGRRAVVFDRIEGVALTTVAEKNPLRMGRVARTLAQEHARVHRVASDHFPDVRDVAADLVGTAPFAGFTARERAALLDHLASLPGGDSVLHLDFHPMNVFRHGGGIATIDWQSTASGDPAADVAMTRLLFTEAELFPGATTAQLLVYGAARGAMGRMYLTEYLRATGMTTASLDRWATAARVLRLGMLDIPSERERLVRGIRSELTR
ncbi:Phosphotransferase enzyme family protein [Microbacterium sp. LKL04]|uniref:aminoglycoside phosphotransferase family protein n=1 Tax=Microbacterium sp. LKL04 TaxID=912630 RepID=UPI000875EA5A|nr:aminoglycoside phosphotransferase family protein [Microbacterium sp. LKL04]SCY33350.1 Phosphotransferase enzyme family protein [Microbacterium sp. LKL04]